MTQLDAIVVILEATVESEDVMVIRARKVLEKRCEVLRLRRERMAVSKSALQAQQSEPMVRE